MKINKWLGHEFESSSTTTKEFADFAREFRLALIRHLPDGASIARFSRGHFEIAGNIERDGKFVYFSISDVRFFPDDWYKHILIRTCKNVLDYTGGTNHYTSLENLAANVENLLSTEIVAGAWRR